MESVHVPSVGRRYWSGIFSSSGDISFLQRPCPDSMHINIQYVMLFNFC